MHDGTTKGGSKRVLIADPQPIFRLGLVALLESAYLDWDIVESDGLKEQRSQLRDGSIDLLIVDSRLLGLEVAQRASPEGRIRSAIIAITEPGDAISALGCLGAGACATVSRSDLPSRTLAIIDSSIDEQRQDPAAEASRGSAGEPPTDGPPNSESLNLTTRQFDVLRSLAKGQSNKVIARDLGLSVSTVKVHLNTVFRALGARNRVEAVVRARPFQERMVPHEQ